MSDIKLFRLEEDKVQMISGSSMAIEKSLQTLIERHLDEFIGVRFLASEYSTTKSHGGRIDTLGIDETNCPVIIEYKRALNENVINQGLFYLNWLMDHRADFLLLVMDTLGAEIAKAVDWRYPRLVCIAGDFTKYDLHAIEQIPQNIELIRYRRYGDALILLEQVAKNSTLPTSRAGKPVVIDESEDPAEPAVLGQLRRCSADVQGWYRRLQTFMVELGDDVEERAMPSYFAFRRLKTFAYVSFAPTKNRLAIEMPLPSEEIVIEQGFTERKPRNYLQIVVDSDEDVARAQPILAMSYERS